MSLLRPSYHGFVAARSSPSLPIAPSSPLPPLLQPAHFGGLTHPLNGVDESGRAHRHVMGRHGLPKGFVGIHETLFQLVVDLLLAPTEVLDVLYPLEVAD